tara:strand:- start:560 stop:772 length:213 start_codon:yes stop_codon:yes gene_type:complete
MDKKDKVLSNLHEAVAEELLRRVLSGEANAADLNVARGFLKDNGIDATADQSEPMANLAKSLPFNIEDVA